MQLLYRDGEGCTFMDRETHERAAFDLDALEAELTYLPGGLPEGLGGTFTLVVDGTAVGIELPATVILEVVECAPAMQAASASARNKPATLTTGLVVVPEYLAQGERIKVNTVNRGVHVPRLTSLSRARRRAGEGVEGLPRPPRGWPNSGLRGSPPHPNPSPLQHGGRLRHPQGGGGQVAPHGAF